MSLPVRTGYSLGRELQGEVDAPSHVSDLPGQRFWKSGDAIAAWGRMLNSDEFQRVVEIVQQKVDVDPAAEAETTRRLLVAEQAQAGDKKAREELIARIRQTLTAEDVKIPGVAGEVLAQAVFEVCYGLDVLAPLYADPTVDEIRVSGPDIIVTVHQGVSQREPLRFKTAEQLTEVCRRSLYADEISLREDHPVVESARKDGTRVTACIPPVAKTPTLAIRKFDSMPVSEEAFLEKGSVDQRVLELLRLLTEGRVSQLIAGPTNCGKTHFVRLLVGYLPEDLRIVTLETDREIALERYYPNREIVALEAHPELDPPQGMPELFRLVLRLSPDVIIVGEARGVELLEMVQAALSGHSGSMGTVHVESADKAVDTLCQRVLQVEKNMQLAVLRAQVATAYKIIVQLTRLRSGRRMVKEITELHWDEKRQELSYNPLVVWSGSPDDPDAGDWTFPNKPSAELIKHLTEKGISLRRLREAGLT